MTSSTTSAPTAAMESTNGYGDWNIPWDEYKQGSALATDADPS